MKKSLQRAKKKATSVARSQLPLWVGVTVVILVGVVAYWNSFDVPLVFDDFLTIQRNEGVRFGDSLSPGALGGRSLLYVTFAANYALHQQDVWGYHFVNLVLHLLNGVLVLLLALYTFRRTRLEESKARIYALLAAVFFISHPLQTQAVAYVSSRSELLSTAFYLTALLLFIRIPLRWVGFGLSLVIGLIMYAGLLSKETVISLPAALLAYDFLFYSEGRLRPILGRWKFYVTFLVGGTMAGYYLVTGPLRGAVGGTLSGHLSPWHYLLTQSKVILRYIQLTFLPIGQNLDHDIVPARSPFELAVIFSTAVLVGLLIFAWYARVRYPVVAFSIFWFFLTLAPTSSVMPILDVIFEHRMYLPLVGLCLSFPIAVEGFKHVVAALAGLLKKRIRMRPRLIPVSAGILTALTIGTVMRNEVWRDEVRLWADVVSKSPEKARGYNALAMSHFRKGQYEEGLQAAREGLQEIPDQSNLFVDTIGNMYLGLRRYDEAVEIFREAAETEAAKTSPDESFVGLEFNNVGVAYLYKWGLLRENEASVSATNFEREKLKILESALKMFTRSLEYSSNMSFPALDSQVNVMSLLDRAEEVRLEREGMLVNGEEFESRYVLGKLAFNAEDFETAVEHFEKAAKFAPQPHLFWFNYGYSLDRIGRQDEAIETYTEAIRLNPVFIEAHHNIGQLRIQMEEYDTAIDNFEEVLRLYPGHVSANLRLAYIYVEIGQPSIALQHVTAVLETSPNNQEALELLGRIG